MEELKYCKSHGMTLDSNEIIGTEEYSDNYNPNCTYTSSECNCISQENKIFNKQNFKRDCIYMKFFIEMIDKKISNIQAKYILHSFLKKYALLIVAEYQKQKKLKIDMIDIKKFINEDANYYEQNIFDSIESIKRRDSILKETVKIDSSDEYIKCLNVDKSIYFLNNNLNFNNTIISDEDRKVNSFICRICNTNIVYSEDLIEAITVLENKFSGSFKVFGQKLEKIQERHSLEEIKVLCTLANEINIISRLVDIFQPLGIIDTENRLLEDYLFIIQADIIERTYDMMKNKKLKTIRALYEKEIKNEFGLDKDSEKNFFEINRRYRIQIHYDSLSYVIDNKQDFINKQMYVIKSLDKVLSFFLKKDNKYIL